MASGTVKEIERAIQGLTLQEIQELYSWLEEHYPQPIDVQTQGRSSCRSPRLRDRSRIRRRKEQPDKAALAFNAAPCLHRFLDADTMRFRSQSVERADKQFALLKQHPNHPSLQFKKIGDRRAQRNLVGEGYAQIPSARHQARGWILVVLDRRS